MSCKALRSIISPQSSGEASVSPSPSWAASLSQAGLLAFAARCTHSGLMPDCPAESPARAGGQVNGADNVGASQVDNDHLDIAHLNLEYMADSTARVSLRTQLLSS